MIRTITMKSAPRIGRVCLVSNVPVSLRDVEPGGVSGAVSLFLLL